MANDRVTVGHVANVMTGCGNDDVTRTRTGSAFREMTSCLVDAAGIDRLACHVAEHLHVGAA